MLRPRSYRRAFRAAVLAAGDVFIASLCLTMAIALQRAQLLPFSLPQGAQTPAIATRAILFSLSLLVALAAAGFYTVTSSPRHRPSILVALVVQIAIVGIMSTMLTIVISRTTLLVVVILEPLLLFAWRRALHLLWPLRVHVVTVVGRAADVERLLADRAALERARIDVRAVVTTDDALDDDRFTGRFGEPAAMDAISSADEVIDVSSAVDDARRLELLRIRGPRGFCLVPSSTDALLSSSDFSSVGDHVLTDVSMRGSYGSGALLKRAFDLVVATFLLLVVAPLLLVAMAAIAFSSGRPLLLRQERVGRGGRVFRMLKLRTMNAGGGFERATEGDSRLTNVGRVLRRYRLDELPQLLNVIVGDMSLVGPRPEIPELTVGITAQLPSFPLRLHGLPGIAGLAQVSAEYDQTPETKLAFDLQYLCNWSLWQDVRILGRAVTTALAGRGL